MRISAALPPGVTALLFEAAEGRRRLEDRLTAELTAAGYGEVLLPVLDYHEPYDALTSPARRGRLYRFIGRDGEQLALRADFTPMLARLLAPRLAALDPPLRLFYRGDVVRHEEEPGGHWHELYQLGAERVGGDGEAAEREALETFVRLVAAASPAPPVRLVLGFAGALDRPLAEARERGIDPAALAAALERRERRAARVAGGVLPEVVEHGVPADPERLGVPAAARLAALESLRARLAESRPTIELTIDLAEFARNTLDPELPAGADPDYYDGLVFRAYAGRAARAVGSGGRYDRLFHRLGVDTAAAGFTLGLDRLTVLAEEAGR